MYIKRAYELNKSHIISTDEDPGLRIESIAVINLRGVSTNKTIICFIAMQTYKELIKEPFAHSIAIRTDNYTISIEAYVKAETYFGVLGKSLHTG